MNIYQSQIISTLKKIGITGSSGLFGSLLIKELKKKKIKYSCFLGDITKFEDIENWLSLEKDIEYIFHLAAYTSVIKSNSEKKKTYRVNVTGTENILKSINSKNKNYFLFFSSSSHVYKFSKKPLSEKSTTIPISYYGKTKLLAERKIKRNKKKNFNYFIGRIFSIFHKSQKKPFLYPSIVEKIKNCKSKKIFIKNGNCIRDFSNAEKIIKIFLKVYKKKISGVYNIGSGTGTSIKNFIYKNISRKKIVCSNDKINISIANINKIKNKLI
jgi:UDP-glucose 4-epimerase